MDVKGEPCRQILLKISVTDHARPSLTSGGVGLGSRFVKLPPLVEEGVSDRPGTVRVVEAMDRTVELDGMWLWTSGMFGIDARCARHSSGKPSANA